MTDSINVTLEQLEVIKKLIRGSEDSIAYTSAKLVLVDKKSRKEVAVLLGAKAHAVASGVRRYTGIYNAIREAF